ncbi:hypothetical protein DH2020_020367 [Rehmannia glutinosa]|uniref:BHLH domain-containing protein n=1 Tax=Rehmannia glutinosa TaxID=99300 RepID=A0ABR0WFW9_REHGL
MGALIDSMLLQVHVLGGGVIGQVAFTENHLWMYSDAHQERQNSLASFENLEMFQDDSEFYSQFPMGIKTIALISVEPWGVVQFGSTEKNPETKDFVNRVKNLFRGMYTHQETKFLENEPPSDSQFFDSSTQFNSLLSVNQNLNQCANSEGFIQPNQSLFLPSQSYSSNNQLEQLLLESANLFDCSAKQALSNNSDCSVLTSSWPHSTISGLKQNVSFSKDMLTTQNITSSPLPIDHKSEKPSGLLTLDEFFQESDFAKANFNPGLDDDLSQLFAPFTNLSQATGLIPISGLSGNNSPIHLSKNLPTNSIQSSVTDAFGSNPGYKKPMAWNETLIPVGLDQLLDGVTSTSSCSFANQSSSAAKRRKIDNFSSSHNSFDGKLKSLNTIIELDSEVSNKERGSCIGDSCIMDAGNASSSTRQEEPAKNGKRKAKAATRPRPKDRQMIQDRLAELRELVPGGEKMSIDRLLERTIRHLNFMQSLTKHAECLKQIDKPKSEEVRKNNSSKGGGGVTWACEVGDQTMVCPLIVEDLITPGQMLIEILCEEQGFFLEIVDIIRGFGLIILKGVMEVRETKKIWAHFMVEAEGHRCVTRHEIFSSLIQLLQMSGQNPANAKSDGFGNAICSEVPLFNNCQPAAVSFPVNLTDALQCASL